MGNEKWHCRSYGGRIGGKDYFSMNQQKTVCVKVDYGNEVREIALDKEKPFVKTGNVVETIKRKW